MNLLDFVVVGTACAATISGWRFGFFARVLGWAGVAVGLMVGVVLVPSVVTNFGGTAPNGRATAGVVFLALVAIVGEGTGLALAIVIDRLRGPKRELSTGHRVAGASLGYVGGVLLAVLVVPSLAGVPGWPSNLAARSWIASRVGDRAHLTTALSTSIAQAPYARGARESGPSRVAPPPARVALRVAVEQRVRRAVVLVQAYGCGVTVTGTGWAVDTGLVVTAAHVVSGTRDVSVRDARGTLRPADVVTVDPADDIAVVRVHGLRVAPLALGHAKEGETGLVFGHPPGGRLRGAPVRVDDESYRTFTFESSAPVPRRVLLLAARLEEGDSGAPVVSTDGLVLGVVFGVRDDTATAVPPDAVRDVMRRPPRPLTARTCAGFPG